MSARKRSLLDTVVILAGIFSFGSGGAVGTTLNDHDERGVSTDAEALGRAYERWARGYRAEGGDQTLVVPLGFARGLSVESTQARGRASLNLVVGSASVEVRGLPAAGAFEVWIVDNQPGPEASVMPEPGDGQLSLGMLQPGDGVWTLETGPGVLDPDGFEIDLVVVGWAGTGPNAGGLLFGSPHLFQRLFYRAQRGWFISIPDLRGQKPEAALEALIRRGRQLFLEETFDGNGRTCGTCHPANNNFTLDPEFIATLPDDDPLFVAEFDDNLAALENPTLMRDFGLILENVDGFEDPTSKFVMRGVPHTLALTTSIENGHPDEAPVQSLGWSADGAPRDGSLRSFAVGAVIQHFTRKLDRVEGEDFRLPREDELDAMEAFQLSLGRQQDLDLSAMTFLDPEVAEGLEVFLGPGRCNTCHVNAGANAIFAPDENRDFDTGVENFPHPAYLTGEPTPRDGGAGTDFNEEQGAFGTGAFNTPSLVEAADTPPFFHNNVVSTLEEAVAFYNSVEFNTSPSGQFNSISLSDGEVLAVTAFLRALNALENIRSALSAENEALRFRNRTRWKTLLAFALSENEDAIQVLLKSDLHPGAVVHLKRAGKLLERAAAKRRLFSARRLIRAAIARQKRARSGIVHETEPPDSGMLDCRRPPPIPSQPHLREVFHLPFCTDASTPLPFLPDAVSTMKHSSR